MEQPGKKRPRYWFVRKRFGYGWRPLTWQGWLITISYLIAIILISMNYQESITVGNVTEYYVVLALLMLSLIAICVATGEKPKWQWG